MEVWLDDGTDYYGLDLKLAYDSGVVSVDTGRATPLWEVFHPVFHFVIKNEADSLGGTLWYAVTNTNPAGPFSGTGRVCGFSLTGMAPGQSALSFSYSKGSTRDGDAIWPKTVGVGIVVLPEELYTAYLPLVGLEH